MFNTVYNGCGCKLWQICTENVNLKNNHNMIRDKKRDAQFESCTNCQDHRHFMFYVQHWKRINSKVYIEISKQKCKIVRLFECGGYKQRIFRHQIHKCCSRNSVLVQRAQESGHLLAIVCLFYSLTFFRFMSSQCDWHTTVSHCILS